MSKRKWRLLAGTGCAASLVSLAIFVAFFFWIAKDDKGQKSTEQFQLHERIAALVFQTGLATGAAGLAISTFVLILGRTHHFTILENPLFYIAAVVGALIPASALAYCAYWVVDFILNFGKDGFR